MVATCQLAKEESQWSLESLNKAYQKGYMAGLTDHPLNAAEVLTAAWEARWWDGQEQAQLQPHSKSA